MLAVIFFVFFGFFVAFSFLSLSAEMGLYKAAFRVMSIFCAIALFYGCYNFELEACGVVDSGGESLVCVVNNYPQPELGYVFLFIIVWYIMDLFLILGDTAFKKFRRGKLVSR